VYINAWKPLGTDIKVYSKIYNKADNDAFDDKNWTPLIQLDPHEDTFSNKINEGDVIEYTYGLPYNPLIKYTTIGTIESAAGVTPSTAITGTNTVFNYATLVGTVTVTSGSTQVVGSGTTFSAGGYIIAGGYIDITSAGGVVNTRKVVNIVDDTHLFVDEAFTISAAGVSLPNPNKLSVGNLIRISDPGYLNQFVCKVAAVASNTAITLDIPLSDPGLYNGLTGMKIDKLFFDNTAWKNRQNYNMTRYYNSSNALYDGFHSFAIKVVLTSQTLNLAPYVFDIRAIGVSA